MENTEQKNEMKQNNEETHAKDNGAAAEKLSDVQVEQNESSDAGKEANETNETNEVLKLQNDIAEQKDKYIRLYSEFENFRRRTAKEKLELVQTANEQLIRALLPVIDDFERAEKSLREKNDKDLEGIILIYNKFKKTLDQYGVKAMEFKSGDDFNADIHEAITQIPAAKEELKGKVIDVVEKGYLLNEKVIRFAKVVVGS